MGKYAAAARGLNKNKNGEKESTSSVKYAGSAAASGKQESEKSFQTRLQKETKNLYSQTTGSARGAGTSYTRSTGGASSSPASTPVSTQLQGSLYAQVAKQMRTTPQSPAATAPLTQGSQYSQPRPAAMPGLTGAQRQMIAERNTAPQMTYSQILQRNMAAARQGSVTPDMVAELEAAGRREREERRERLRQLNADIYAASESLYTPQVQMTTPDRRELSNGVTDGMGISDVKAALPGLQESFEYARDRYQRLMDRNIRMANETGAVSPEMVAELYQAERDKNEADRRYQDALARNEQMSYSERMGSLQTDVGGIAELLAQREAVNRNGFAGMGGQNNRGMDESRQQLAVIDAQIEAVRESLRREGLSEDEIQSLFDYQVRLKNAEDTEAMYQRYLAEAQGNTSFENWVMNTSMGLYSGASYIDLLAQGAGGLIRGADPITGQARRIDYNSELQGFQHSGEAVMQGEMDKLLEKYGVKDENGEITGMSREGRIRAGAYQLAVSMGQSAAVAGLTAVGAPCAMLLLSGSAATSTAHQMHEQGFSDGASLLMGGIAGAAEYVTEKIGMDQLFKTRDISTAKNVLKTALQNFVNQSLAEGGEEVLSTVINTLADVIVNGDKSELESQYRELMAQGMTEDQAQKIAAREWLSGVWNDFYMGAISGGLFSMGGMTFQTGRNAIIDSRTGRQIADANVLDQLIEQINTLDGNIAEEANVPESFNPRNNREVGSAARAIERAQVMENMRAELEARGEENVSPELLSGMYASSQQEPQRLTGEERKALRGSETAMELVREWSDQWGDNSVPAPFEGLEDILRSQMEQKENAPQEGAMEEGAIHGEQGIDGTPENGNDGVRAGEQGTGISELGEEGTLPGSEGQVRESVSEGRGENLRSVTLRELGVTNAAEGATIQVQDEQSLTGDAARAAQQVRQQGLEPVAFRGEMIVNGASVNGYIENGRVFFRTDAKYRDGTPISSEAIVRHESVHNAKDSDPGIIDIGMEIVRQNRSEAEVLEMMDAYRETYKDLYDFEKMSEEDITDMLVEEIVADAYAGMNYFRDGGETVEQVRTAIGNQVENAQAAERVNENRGPPRAVAAGRNARTADSQSLSRAEEMERNGSANEEIRQETGWYRGMDGQWRFEIDDSGAKYYRNGDAQFRKDHPEYARYQDLMSQFLTGNLNGGELMELQALEQTWGREQGRLKEMVDSGRATLGMILDHEDLFEAYPELRDARVRFADLRSGEKGYYDPRHNNLTISNDLRNAPEDTLIHEIQHAVQDIEGFSGGASAEYWENQERNGNVSGWKSEETLALENEYQELLDSLPEETRQMIREVNQAYADSDFDRIDDLEDQLANGPYGDQYYDLMALEGRLLTQKDSDRKINAQANYLNTAGEIEARDAANRRGMTAEERKNTPPDLGDENTVFAEDTQRTPYMKAENWVTEEDMDEYLRAGTRENKKKREALAKGKKILLTNEAEIREYIRTSIKNAGENATAAYGKVDAQLADVISEITVGDVDIKGDFLEFVPFDIQHAFDEHHNPKETGDISLSVADYESIPTYFSTFDELLDVHTYGSSNQTTITVSKKVGNGRVVIVEVVSKSRGALQFKNMIGVSEQKYNNETKPKYQQSLLNAWGNQGSTVAQRFNTALSKSSIAQSTEKSNPQNGPRASAEVNTNAAEERKQKQAELILKNNPHDDSLGEHTWIRSADDVHTYEEGLAEDGIEVGDNVAPDYTAGMIEEAKRTGQITVYSSHQIGTGTFVTPSAMEAKSYAGDGPIYSKTISTADVAWLDSIQGQYAPVTEETTPGRASAEVTNRRSLERELQERQEAYQKASDRNDTEYDYRGELAKIRELEQRLEGMRETDTSSAEGETTPQSAEPTAPLTQGSQDQMEAARAELLENGKATMENDTGTYTIELQEKAGNDIRARIRRDGKLDRVQSFENREEAAEYALSYVDGQTKARTDAELDRERSEQREKPGPHWPTGKEYGEEIVRQKQNKAADAATQTLRERIRRANEELKALRRLDKTTGLTDQQRAHMNDVQETLDIMNDELTSRKGRRAAKKEKTRTKGAVENMPTRSAADAKNALMEQFHTAAGERAEVGRQIEAKLNEIARSGRITDENRQALYDLLIENGVVPKHAESTYQEIRNSLRGQRIFVNEQERADLGDDFETLRRRAWANGIYLTNNPNDGKIDAVNMEMAEAFGENLFPTNEALSDMLSNMIDQAERGRTVQQSLHESIRGEARETGRNANEIYSEMFSQMDETLRTFAEKAGLEVALKDRTATQLAEERQRWEDRLERRAQARRESEVRGKVLRGLQRLSKLRGKAGPEIRAQVDEVLKDIDTQARQITPAGLENLQALQRAYEEAREAAGYVDGENMGNWIPKPYIEERLAALTKKHVNDMSLEEVVDLGRTVAGLENAIRTQNQMIGEEFDATIEESAKGVREDVESSRGAKAGFLHKWLMEEHLSPRRFLDMLGGWKTDGAMSKLSQSLEDGQTRMLDYQRRAVQSFDPFLSKKANRQWLERASGKKAEWTSYEVLDGYSEDGGSYKTIELTPMMKISLYLHSRNMDNLRHIQTGGIVIPNKALYQKGKMAEAYAQGERIRMNPETVRKIAGELTETERTFANHMITLFDNISKDAINEVSLQLDGFERAGVENYMPIETDRSFLKSDVAGEARAATVEGIGSIANERVHASNPILLDDASDVLMRQIDKVSRYYGYAIPIRNFQAVNNYVFHEEGAPFSTSIKEIMNRKWGSGAEQFITKMLEDLQSSGRRGDMMSSALSKLRGNLAGATLMFNPSVAVSQTASYPGAAQAVGWDGLAHGLVAGRVDPKLIEKYSPLYWYRNQGNSTQELGDYMSDKGLEQKLPWIMNWIQKMDSATIRRLWAASEYRVSKDNPGLRPGSQADIDAGKDAYYQKVAEVFNRAVYDTQPNYTNMERAQILRSNSDVTRFLTMYKTVPLQYYGMMVEATGRLQAAMKSGDQAKITEARKYAVNTFGGLLAANTVYVAMKALFKGFRKKDKDYRDEEGNLTAGSVAAQLGKDLAETYAGSIIGGAEMYSVAESLLTGSKFYGPEMSALSYVEDMVGAVNSIFKSIGEEDPRKAAGAIKDAAVTLAQGFGVPAQNMETYLMAGVRWMFPDVAMEYDNLFGGIERGDMKSMDEQAVGTATNLILQNRTGLKIDQSVTDELARLYSVGELAAIPTNTPSSFSYNGKTVQISNRGAYSDAWGGIVGDNLEDLVTTDDYVAADDGQRAALVNKLYQYATVEARRGADPEYSADGNSTYGWTVKADEAVEAGVGLVDAICALDAFSHMTADKDENGNSISGSKKAKVCDYIDAMDITDEQKDVMYLLSGYKENSLEYTPWHGWDEDEESGSGSGSGSGKSGGKGSGGKRSGGRGGGSRKAKAPKTKAVKGSGSKIRLPKVSSGSGTEAGKAEGLGKGADASLSLIQIIDRYYGGNALAAAMDGGARARGRTTVDFEL